MELTANYCRKCGGILKRDGDVYRCEYCGAEYTVESSAAYADEVKKTFGDALAAQREEQIANIRNNLYAAAHETYTDSAKIIGYCRELKKLLPDDFQAVFYETANSASAQELAAFISGIDVESHVRFLGDMAEFLIKSLRSETVNSVAYFIDRLEKVDPLLHAEWAEKFSAEARKVEDGIYDVSVPRDVFVAYRSSDMPKVVGLVNYLEEEEGLKCFASYRNLQHGRDAKSDYDGYLKRAIDSCKVLVFVSSVTSRAQGDARNKELPYVYAQDFSRAPAEFSARGDYVKLPKKYKKPRVEYVIESYKNTASDEYVKTFFDGFTRRETPRAVAEAVFEIYDGRADSTETDSPARKKVKFCSECGEENDGDVKFCRNCGNGKFLPTHEEFLEYKSRNSEEARRRAAEKRAEAERAKAESRAEIERIRAESRAEKQRIREENRRKRAAVRADRRERAAEVLGSVFGGIGGALLSFFNPRTAFGKTVFIVLTLGGIGLGFFNMIYPFVCGRPLAFVWGDSVWLRTLIAYAVILVYDIAFGIISSVKYWKAGWEESCGTYNIGIVAGLAVIGGASIFISWLAEDVLTFWLIYGIAGGIAGGIVISIMLYAIYDSVDRFEYAIPLLNVLLAFTVGANCYALMHVAQQPSAEPQSAAVAYCMEDPAYGGPAVADEYILLYEN